MVWTPDPELQQMFLDEIDQRSGRLVSVARSMAGGDSATFDLSMALREAHTIKGTARVMGYEAVGLSAKMIEDVLREISNADLEQTRRLGGVLETFCAELSIAARENPQDGTPRLRAVAGALHQEVPVVAVPNILVEEFPRGYKSPTADP